MKNLSNDELNECLEKISEKLDTERRKRFHKQLMDWLAGTSTHNFIDDTCCPDFSCCKPELLAPYEIRRMFVIADIKDDESTTMRLLGEFLGKAMSIMGTGKSVHIAGLDEMRQERES